MYDIRYSCFLTLPNPTCCCTPNPFSCFSFNFSTWPKISPSPSREPAAQSNYENMKIHPSLLPLTSSLNMIKFWFDSVGGLTYMAGQAPSSQIG